MATGSGGARHLAKSIRKQVKALDAELDAATAHCRMIRKMARDPSLDLGGAQRIAANALRTAQAAAKKHDKLWSAIRTVTSKMPNHERKALRGEIERDLRTVEKKIAALDKAGKALIGEIEKLRKEKPPAGAGDDPLLVSVQFLRALVTIWKGWKARRKKDFP